MSTQGSINLMRWGDRIALPVSQRALLYALLMLALAACATLAALTLGAQGLSLRELWQVLGGGGTPVQQWIIYDVRLPRAVTAMAVGAALGLAGALFQSVTRNPLGSPEVMGLTSGASAGAVAFTSLLPGLLAAPAGAALGALCAALAVWFFSGAGFRVPHRMVVAGIGIGAIGFACVQLSLSSLRRDEALEAAVWLYGSLASKSWVDAAAPAAASALLLPLALALLPRLELLELGDDVAQALGASADRVRFAAVALAVLATAAAVSAAGPIAFIALSAPQIARRCARSAGPAPVPSALTGAALLTVADVLARHIGATGLPVGLLTAGIGGIYLAFLVLIEWRKVST